MRKRAQEHMALGAKQSTAQAAPAWRRQPPALTLEPFPAAGSGITPTSLISRRIAVLQLQPFGRRASLQACLWMATRGHACGLRMQQVAAGLRGGHSGVPARAAAARSRGPPSARLPAGLGGRRSPATAVPRSAAHDTGSETAAAHGGLRLPLPPVDGAANNCVPVPGAILEAALIQPAAAVVAAVGSEARAALATATAAAAAAALAPPPQRSADDELELVEGPAGAGGPGMEEGMVEGHATVLGHSASFDELNEMVHDALNGAFQEE